ncbi:MAG: phosphoribosyltransferase [Candidatus Dormibacteraeota bacterium]|nr:phosphoribosyltransferase [Candidatus Dormibacteraeota bacterium]
MERAEALARDALLARFAWQNGHADVWRVFDDESAFAAVVAGLAAPWLASRVSKVCGVEARGFILGSAVALRLGAGFVAIRKAGALFPGPKDSQKTAPDYRGMVHQLEIQQRALAANDRVLLVDDWAEEGSQAIAAKRLIEQRRATFLGLALMVDQLSDAKRGLLGEVRSIVRAAELPASS